MNCSEPTKQLRSRNHRRLRKMLFAALLIGVVIGSIWGMAIKAGQAIAVTEALLAAPKGLVFIGDIAIVQSAMGRPPIFMTNGLTLASTFPATVKSMLLGTFRITAYCSCEKCCGKWALNRPDGVVYGAAGVELKAGISAASPLPFGTVVEVEGLGKYVVQDRPAKWVVEKYGKNQLDIYFDNHEEACAFGLQYLNVYEITE